MIDESTEALRQAAMGEVDLLLRPGICSRTFDGQLKQPSVLEPNKNRTRRRESQKLLPGTIPIRITELV